jgi:hypothetical protein
MYTIISIIITIVIIIVHIGWGLDSGNVVGGGRHAVPAKVTRRKITQQNRKVQCTDLHLHPEQFVQAHAASNDRRPTTCIPTGRVTKHTGSAEEQEKKKKNINFVGGHAGKSEQENKSNRAGNKSCGASFAIQKQRHPFSSPTHVYPPFVSLYQPRVSIIFVAAE